MQTDRNGFRLSEFLPKPCPADCPSARLAGIGDWLYHRLMAKCAISRKERQCDWLPDTGRFDFANADGGRLEIVTRDAPRPSPSISRRVAVHDPAELDDSPPGEETIVLAGHLHGGQWVISAKGGRLLPAA